MKKCANCTKKFKQKRKTQKFCSASCARQARRKGQKPSPGALVKMEREEVAKILLEECGGDMDTAMFFAEWIRNGRNATKAAKTIRPHLSDASAKVVGSRLLTSVNLLAIFNALDLGILEYIEHLKNGLNAEQVVIEKNTETGEITARTVRAPDHAVRKQYHDKLGQILGIESKDGGTNVAVQVNNLINQKRSDYNI